MKQIYLTVGHENLYFNNRALGTIGMICSPMLLASFIIYALFDANPHKNQIAGAFQILYLAGWMSSVVGMRMIRATGNTIGSGITFVIQIIGLILAMCFNVLEMSQQKPDETSLIFRITDAAYPLSHLFMLVVGVFVLRAKQWRGWRRLTPFLCGLALPLTILLGLLFGRMEKGAMFFGVITAIAFMLFGNAVRTSSQRI